MYTALTNKVAAYENQRANIYKCIMIDPTSYL